MESGGSNGNTESGAGGGGRIRGVGLSAGATSASWAAWETYYREASRRRRAQGHGRTFRDEKRKRRLRERLGFLLSTLLVAAMTGVFYLVLK